MRQCCEGAVHSDRVFISYERCGHNVSQTTRPAEALSAPWEIIKRWADPCGITRRLNDLNCHFVTAFFDNLLKGDAEKAAYLTVPTPCGKDADGKAGTGWPGFPEAAPAGVILEHFPKQK